MNFYDRFKAFLGLPTNRDQENLPNTNRSEKNPWKDYHHDETPLESPFREDQHFSIFSDPLEISRYFEQQMDEMLKSFGFGNFIREFPFGQFGGNLGQFNNQLEYDDSGENGSSGELRDRFLKPGYEESSHGQDQPKEDKDVDGKLDFTNLDTIFDGGRKKSVMPHGNFQSFSKNIMSTIMNPDGTVETRNTFRDSQGNEETRITRKNGDKEYTVIKRIDKDGKETITENFINIEKDEVEKYFPPRNNDDRPGIDPPNWGFFNKFFKM